VLCSEGRSSQAIPLLQAYVGAHPESYGAKLQLAEALERAADMKGAERELRTLLSVDSVRPVAGRKLLALLEALGRVAEAEQLKRQLDPPKRQVRPLRPSSRQTLFFGGERFSSRRQTSFDRQRAGACIKAAPMRGLFVVSLAWAAVAHGLEVLPPTADVMAQLAAIEAAGYHSPKVDDLRLKYQDAARAKPSDALPKVMVAWCTLPSDDAWNQLKAIAQIFPEHPWVRYGMGRIYTSWKGMGDLARTEFEAVLKRDPTFYPALVGLGDVARVKGDFGEAERRYRAALAIDDDAFAHAGLGLTLALEQKLDEARAELRKAIDRQPEQPSALITLVKLALEAKDPEAVKAAQAWADLRPKDRQARKTLADLRFDAGEKAVAAKEYERLIRLGFPEREVLVRLAALGRELGDGDTEERTLQTLAAVDDKDPHANLRLAELKLAKKDFEGAEGQWREALARDPTLAAAHVSIGAMKLDQGQLVDALEEFRAAKRIDPANADTQAAVAKLEGEFKLPAKRAHGAMNTVYWLASRSLGQVFDERKQRVKGLGGTLRLRVRVNTGGTTEGVDVLEDQLKDQVLLGHVYFVLRDADYPKQKSEPVFAFELGEKKKGK
jgi:tetratricopeptide (TPR) repeat protein